MTALALTGLHAGYDRDLPIVKGVSFTVQRGEAVCILGPNGAGKSTMIKAIAGLVPCFGGEVRLDGTDITGLASHVLVGKGMGFVPQMENIFTRLTILENLQIAAQLLPKQDRAGRIDAMFDMFPDLGSRPRELAGALSGGQRQMLAAARALLTEPRVLMLDEPSAGLSPKLVGQVFDTLRRISETGVTLVLVEQNVRAALGLTERALVLVDGQLAHDGPADALHDGRLLGELFLGHRTAEAGS
ncbi:branched-chain amino acid ABC transporter ATP-binding protein [Hoeflea sp. BAL378]|uniref:ABC transporter ATP-binding protein n=1 Tax=Hoeflea sp. BAL378 TaxID=1547437 RepID=UPI0005135EA9|nr:ABC transporter ATP-binding protein [Hoeflea sp. BAL378]KGF70005.1 branched-chain amino acid ABC transporter ATP-binding protein [Hoeflea sp. BAL378]